MLFWKFDSWISNSQNSYFLLKSSFKNIAELINARAGRE